MVERRKVRLDSPRISHMGYSSLLGVGRIWSELLDCKYTSGNVRQSYLSIPILPRKMEEEHREIHAPGSRTSDESIHKLPRTFL